MTINISNSLYAEFVRQDAEQQKCRRALITVIDLWITEIEQRDNKQAAMQSEIDILKTDLAILKAEFVMLKVTHDDIHNRLTGNR